MTTASEAAVLHQLRGLAVLLREGNTTALALGSDQWADVVLDAVAALQAAQRAVTMLEQSATMLERTA